MLLVCLDLPRRLRAHHKVARRCSLSIPSLPLLMPLMMMPFKSPRFTHHKGAIFVVELGAHSSIIMLIMLPMRCVMLFVGQVEAFAPGVGPTPLRLLLAVIDVGVLHEKLIVVLMWFVLRMLLLGVLAR